MRCEVLAMQHTKVFWYFRIAAHRISHPRASIYTTKSRTYQRKEYCKCFEHHERLAMAAQEGVADDRHHVADRSRGAFRVGKAVGTAHEVVGGKVLEHVTEQTLDS